MECCNQLIEEAVLSLLLTFNSDSGNVWQGFGFEIMNRLREQNDQ